MSEDTKRKVSAHLNALFDDYVARRSAAAAARDSVVFPVTSMYRPDLPRAVPATSDFGPRHDIRDGAKSTGWLGPLQSRLGNTMTEYSMGVEGQGVPSFVPTLNRREVGYLLTEPHLPPIPTQQRAIDDAVYHKAVDWARARKNLGLSAFFN